MKIVAVVQARMGSERLPGKVLKPLAGKPVLWHITQILKSVSLIDDIIIVATTLENDDKIENFALKNNIKIIKGSVHDVLDRFRLATIKTNADVIIRITGDNPCMDTNIIKKVINAHLNSKYDYTSNNLMRTFPRGMDLEVINRGTLEKVWRNAVDMDDREHVTLYIKNKPDQFKLQNVVACELYNRPELRLSIDTKEDYLLVSHIYNNCYNQKPLNLDEIINYLDSHPEIKNINSNIEQKKIKGYIY